MDRRKVMLVIGITAILIGSLIMLSSGPHTNNLTENIRAEMLSTEGLDSRNPVVLDFNGTFHAFWVSSLYEDGKEKERIFTSVFQKGSWSPSRIITNADIFPVSLSGMAYGNTGVLCFTERGGAGGIKIMKSTDYGDSWSEPYFLMSGEYPEFWTDDTIYMISYNMFGHNHTVVRFDGDKEYRFAVNDRISLPPKVTPVCFSGSTYLFFTKNGTLSYSSFEKDFTIDSYDAAVSWKNVSKFHPVVYKNTLYVFLSTFEPEKNRLRIWWIYSSDMKDWSMPHLISDAAVGTSFSASAAGNELIVAWNSDGFTHIRIIGSQEKTVEILPAGDEYFLSENVLLYSSGELSKKEIYAYVIH